MSEDTTQAGSRPVKRRPMSRLTLILLAVAATGLIAIAAVAAAYQFGGTVAGTTAAPSSTPAPSPMDEQGYCVLMVSAGGDAADLIAAYAAEATRETVDWTKAEQVSANLKTIRNIAPDSHRADVDTHIAAVDAILDMHRSGFAREYDLEPVRTAGLRMAAQCAKYAG